VKKILLIAFQAGETAGSGGENREAKGFGGTADTGHGFFVELRVADDSTFADVGAFEFELRFDEDEQVGAGFGAGRGAGKDFRDGDEGNIDHDEVNLFVYIGGCEVSGISLDAGDARVFV
jgi:hypothetical protein